MKIQRAVALRTSKLLIEKNMTQYALAKKMLTPQTTITHIMHEEYKSIKFETMVKIADAFDMDILEFLNDEVFKRENLDIY
ncbi:MAG TPA: XRE family transcriptional regulator [Clostridiales bacterium]|nr:XRE family transcriptional regulator [Clostridiales bacterium]